MTILGRRWLQIFASGLVLLYLVERTLVATANLNYVPSVILLGAFLVPVTFVTYLYERLPDWDVPLPAVAVCFLWGGVLGDCSRGDARIRGGEGSRVYSEACHRSHRGVGQADSAAHLLFYGTRYRSEAAGIVLGVATAAGFAALETMGYGFVSLLASRGNLGVLDEVLLVRGLTSPAGHMA